MNKNPDTSLTEKNITRRNLLKVVGAIFAGVGLAALRPNRIADEPLHTYPENNKRHPLQHHQPESESQTSEFLFFKTADEANNYLIHEEHTAGFDRNNMTDKDLRDHRTELRHHSDRTIRFVMSQNKFYELKNQGHDPQQLIQKQVETVNDIYKNAGVPIKYTLLTTLIIDWSVSSTEINHQHGDGVTVGDQGKIQYAWTDDTLWVMADDQLHAGTDQRIMFIFNPDENGVDHGYVHEIVHHTGIHDLYRSRGSFREGPLYQVRPYDRDLMCKQETLELTPASTLGINKFLEIPYYGPQHDAPVYLTDNENRLTNSFAKAWYNLFFTNKDGNSIKSQVARHSVVSGLDAEGKFVPTEATMADSGESLAITENSLVNTKYSLFDIGQLRLPVERLHYIYANLYKLENNGVVPITIRFMVEPQTFVPDRTISIEIVPVGMESQIQDTYFGKQVIAYSQIANTGMFTVWLNGRLSQEPDNQNNNDLG